MPLRLNLRLGKNPFCWPLNRGATGSVCQKRLDIIEVLVNSSTTRVAATGKDCGLVGFIANRSGYRRSDAAKCHLQLHIFFWSSLSSVSDYAGLLLLLH